MSLHHIKAIAIDLDGTLLDTIPDLCASVNLVLDEMGHEPLPPPIRSRISPPVPVDAPLNGSTVVGKLCVSAFSEITVLISLIMK